MCQWIGGEAFYKASRALSEEDSIKAISEPAIAAGVVVTPEALAETYRLTRG